jgi:hypothetical protein
MTFPYIILNLRAIPKIIVMSWIQSETPNNLQTHHKKYLMSTLAMLRVKCVTLRVGEYVYMIEIISPRNNQQHDLDFHDNFPHIPRRSLSVEPQCQGFKQSHIPFTLSRDILLARDYFLRYPTITFWDTQGHLYDHPIMKWRLMPSKYSSSTRE